MSNADRAARLLAAVTCVSIGLCSTACGQLSPGPGDSAALRATGWTLTAGAPTVVLAGVPTAHRSMSFRIKPGGLHAQSESSFSTPDGASARTEVELAVRRSNGGMALTGAFRLTAARPITRDVAIDLPLDLEGPQSSTDSRVTVPLKSGWARAYALGSASVSGEYRLGVAMSGPETPELALPVVDLRSGRRRIGIAVDPLFSGLFALRRDHGRIQATIRWRYAGSQVPVQSETRRFAVWVSADGARFEDTIDTFFRLMLPDVPPGPGWIHDVAMVDYDYLSDGGSGWERDVRALAGMIPPAERRRVALCFHGWYDALGSYCYDSATLRMQKSWVAMARTRRVPLTQDEVRRRLQLARSLGFRVLMYSADGLLQDSAAPGYRPDWDFLDPTGHKICGWQGPDTWGTTFARNPANPEVADWYAGYLAALLKTYGPDVDGFVWDETFYIRECAIAAKPEPAYAGRAMMLLMKRLASQVHAYDPQKVFLSSDDAGLAGPDAAGYALVAHGTYQDSWCHPSAWSYGLFPNWRNALWSCNWSPISNFPWTRWGVETFAVPVAISNGWGDDRGPSEWSPWEREGILALFRERLRLRLRVRCLTEDPAELLASAPNMPAQSDPIPIPAAGESNWALASNGGRATASSEDDYGGGKWGAAGAIDGIRDDSGWGGGHGWASKRGEPLPQWILVTFSGPRPIHRFVVITYQKENSEETAGKWGVLDYQIQVPDVAGGWKTVVIERHGRARKTRVHTLAAPITTSRFRVLVTRVAPLDGQARLLQIEAWGAK